MLLRIFWTWRVVARTFGHRLAPALTLVLFSCLRAIVAAAMMLDSLFYPSLRRVRVHRPIVIIGNPRTGTTFLHRFLVEHGIGVGQPLWRMLYPSLVLQWLLRPLLPVLERFSPARHHSTVAHQTGLTAIETDDVAVFFRYLDGFFLYGFFLTWDDADHRHYFEPETRDTSARDFAWIERLWRRSLVAGGGDRVVAKMFSLAVRTPAFQRRFTDAHLVYMVRDPVQAIPSALSLVTGVLDRRFGFWTLPASLRERFVDRLYRALVDLMLRFCDDLEAGRISRERLIIVSYDRLMEDFEGVMEEVLRGLDVRADEGLGRVIRDTAARQRLRVSKHEYRAEDFGLDPNRIRHDCQRIYSTFGLRER